MNCYVTMFNLLDWPSRMIEHIQRLGMTPILCDHGSTYEPLLNWYLKCGLEVRMIGSGTCYGFFNRGDHRLENDFFCVTDSDLDISDVPDDFVSKAIAELKDNPWAMKTGLSLEINDVPQTSLSKECIDAYEPKCWINRLSSGNFSAGVGATMAIYSPEAIKNDVNFYSAIRLDRPYTARHLPWYYSSVSEMSDEYKFYLNSMDDVGVYSNFIKRNSGT